MGYLQKYSLAIALLLGLALNGYFIGTALQQFKKEDRSISVKGLAEREVKADLAVWDVKTRITTNDLLDGNKAMSAMREKITAFLIQKGIKKDAINQQKLTVIDRMANEYQQNFSGERYILSNTLQVRSTDVELINSVSRMTDELLKIGVVVSSENDYQNNLTFFFTKLNDIKPEMLAEATENAKLAAEEFTKVSKDKLGKLKRASQGSFSITDRTLDLKSESNQSYYGSESDVMKKVRVVISMEYTID